MSDPVYSRLSIGAGLPGRGDIISEWGHAPESRHYNAISHALSD